MPPLLTPAGAGTNERPEADREIVFSVADVDVHYGLSHAVTGVSFDIGANEVTAIIGPSGCGKSTLLRCFNRLNDLIPGARVGGKILYKGHDVYGDGVNATEVRRRIGMVFQKPNPFPKSIYDNVAFGPRLNGMKKGLGDLVEKSLTSAALWDEVKDKLNRSGLDLSGGQQQRLCIARAIAVEPDVSRARPSTRSPPPGSRTSWTS